MQSVEKDILCQSPKSRSGTEQRLHLQCSANRTPTATTVCLYIVTTANENRAPATERKTCSKGSCDSCKQRNLQHASFISQYHLHVFVPQTPVSAPPRKETITFRDQISARGTLRLAMRNNFHNLCPTGTEVRWLVSQSVGSGWQQHHYWSGTTAFTGLVRIITLLHHHRCSNVGEASLGSAGGRY